DVGDVPSAHDQAPRIRIGPEHADEVFDLIDAAAVGSAPRAPLFPVHGPQLAVLPRPLVPDRDLVLLQVADVRVAAQKPEELYDDRTGVELLRRQERKSLAQVEAHLVTKTAQGPD